MTTVVAYARRGHVFMAADALTNVYDRPVASVRKILRVKAGDSEVLLGGAGSTGLFGLFRAKLDIPATPAPRTSDDEIDAWAHGIAARCSDLAVAATLVEDGRMDGAFLLGWGGRVWTLTHHTAVAHPDGRATVGSGQGLALGALDAMHQLAEHNAIPADPARFVVEAVRIAVGRDRHSGGEIRVEMLPPESVPAAA